MKKIFLNMPITDTRPEFYVRLKDKYNIEISKDIKFVNLVVWHGVLPIILFGYAWPIKQKTQYKYVCELGDLNSLKLALFGRYDVWLSINLFSVSTCLGFLITRIRKKKFGVRVKEWFFKKHNTLGKISAILSKPIAQNCDFLIAHSKKSYNFVIKDLKVNKRKIFYSPKPWKDYSEIKYSSKKLNQLKKIYTEPNKKTILFIGRFIPVKGIINLLQSIAVFNEKVNLILVGDHNTAYGNLCKQMAKKLDLDIKLVGQVGKKKGSNEMIYYYLMSDLLVLPNKYCPEEYEPLEIWGGVIPEALSLGIPVIVTDATGCADDLVKEKGTGMVVKQDSVKELEEAIKNFLDNPKRWKLMGERGPKVFKDNNKNSYEGYVKLFESIDDNKI